MIDGKYVASTIYSSLATEISLIKEKNSQSIGLAVILVGDDPASQMYVGRKQKMAQKVGIDSQVIKLPFNTSEEALLTYIDRFNRDETVYGILVQLPLPKHINEQNVLMHIRPDKDVDGFTPENIGKLVLGLDIIAKPCTPLGIIKLLQFYNITIEGKNALVIGRSNIVGKPVGSMLLGCHATVTIAHSRTKDLKTLVHHADILVAAIGKPLFVKGDWIKEGSVVIDVGINKLENGQLVGDVDFMAASQKAGFITPVPGGVGPMTIAMLLTNCLNLFKHRHTIC